MSRFPPRNAPDIAFSWSCCSWVWNRNYIIRTISLSFDFYDIVFAQSSSLFSKSYQMSIFNIFDTIPASTFISIYSTFISTCSWRLVSSNSRHLALHLDNGYDHSYHCYYYYYYKSSLLVLSSLSSSLTLHLSLSPSTFWHRSSSLRRW